MLDRQTPWIREVLLQDVPFTYQLSTTQQSPPRSHRRRHPFPARKGALAEKPSSRHAVMHVPTLQLHSPILTTLRLHCHHILSLPLACSGTSQQPQSGKKMGRRNRTLHLIDKLSPLALSAWHLALGAGGGFNIEIHVVRGREATRLAMISSIPRAMTSSTIRTSPTVHGPG